MAIEAQVNAEQTAAWDGPLFDRMARFKYVIVTGARPHSDRALTLYPPPAGGSVLDIGCGFGDVTQVIAGLIGPAGHAHGVDISSRFVEACRADVTAPNASFSVGDIQSDDLGGPYDYVFSRFGVMFCDNPGAAMRNVRASMTPGARLVVVVWRIREDNQWVYGAQRIVERMLGRPDDYDEPTCGPGPFSMAGADTTSGILVGAGFTDVTLTRADIPLLIGRDVDEALDLIMALGPAGEIIRLWGDRKADRSDDVREALRSHLTQLQTDKGIEGMASTWIVSAISPPA
jgi:SAM-dependent methyltransferase